MDRSLHGWAENYGQIGLSTKIGVFDTDIQSDFYELQISGLPTYKRIVLSPNDFLNNIKKYKEEFIFDSYYSQVYPLANGLKKANLMNFKNIDDVIPFLKKNIDGLYDKYLLLISEFEQNIYGGSVMSDGNSVKIDMLNGLQNQISYGKAAEYTCFVNENGSIRYINCRILEQQLFLEILDSLRIFNRKHKYLSGYFEFAFTSKTGIDNMRLVYFDYKKQIHFYK